VELNELIRSAQKQLGVMSPGETLYVFDEINSMIDRWNSPADIVICGCGCHIDPIHQWAAPDCTRCNGTGVIR